MASCLVLALCGRCSANEKTDEFGCVMIKKTEDSAGVAKLNDARRKMEKRLNYCLNHSVEGVWDWDLKTDTGYRSPRYYEMLGYPNHAFPADGKTWAAMVHPEDRASVLKVVVDLIRKKEKRYQDIYRIQAGDGSYRWVQSRAMVVEWDQFGIPVQLVGSMLDITYERKKDEALIRYKIDLEQEVEKQTQELKTTHIQLETVLDASSESIWICDGKGKVLRINQAAEKHMGIEADKVVGKNVDALVKMGLMDRSISREVLSCKKRKSILQKSPKTGKEFLVTGTPVFDEKGAVSLVITNERDMTDLNRLQNELQQVRNETDRFKDELTQLNLLELKDQRIVAESKAMTQLLTTCRKLAGLKISNVLILGESGTGKGLLAKFFHAHRKKGPFVQINCAALPESLIEAELFGYEKGAFTGAKEKGKIGLFEMARGGTLFLDEIGELPLPVQAKLLKCIEEREIMHIGGLKPIPIDCTVIAATNLNLKDEIRKKRFREDLFFRLNTFSLTIPPLRERPEDIQGLIPLFLDKYNRRYESRRRISPEALRHIFHHPFPGNVRELKNMIQKAVVMGNSDLIDDVIEGFMDAPSLQHSSLGKFPKKDTYDFNETVRSFERKLLKEALKTHGTTRAVASALNMSQAQVFRKLKKYGLS